MKLLVLIPFSCIIFTSLFSQNQTNDSACYHRKDVVICHTNSGVTDTLKGEDKYAGKDSLITIQGSPLPNNLNTSSFNTGNNFNTLRTDKAVFNNRRWQKEGVYYGRLPADELVQFRTRDSKTFKNNDGTKTIVFAGLSHYKDENGKWTDVNYDITPNTSDIFSEHKYCNTTAEIKSYFPENSGHKGVLMRFEDTSFSFWKNPELQIITGKESLKIKSTSDQTIISDNKIIYKDTYDGIDEEFVILENGQGIENNIIINYLNDNIKKCSSDDKIVFNQFIPLDNNWNVYNESGEPMTKDFTSSNIYLGKGTSKTGINCGQVLIFDSHITDKQMALDLFYGPVDRLEDFEKELLNHIVLSDYQITFSDSGIILSCLLPANWLINQDRSFPVTVDPTFTIGALSGSTTLLWDGYYVDTRMQSIYTAGLFTAGGMNSGDKITAIGLYCGTYGCANANQTGLVVRLQNTALATFPSTNFTNAGYTNCYSGSQLINGTGWFNHSFLNNYTFSGSNIIFDLSMDMAGYLCATSHNRWSISLDGTNVSIYLISIADVGDPKTYATGNIYTYRPYLQVTYSDCTPSPSAPVATAASAITYGSFNANWNAVAGAGGYRLDVATDAGFASIVPGYNSVNVGNVLTYNVIGLNCNTTYYYRVRTYTGDCQSVNSNTISTTTLNQGPATPVANSAINPSTTSFFAYWNSSGATTYFLDVSTVSNFASFVAGYNNLNVGNNTSYPVTGLTAGTTYYYRVRATNGCGASGYSNVITVATITCTSSSYTHPIIGVAGENVGSCLETICAGTYYDNGGAAGDYSNGINGTYRVFCPSTLGQCLTATFTSFNTEYSAFWCGGCCDYLSVANGSTQNSPLIWEGCGSGAVGPFTGTINGCLSFRFWSDGSGTLPGWAVTFSSASCAGGPTGLGSSDCLTFNQLCSNSSISGNSTGPGIIAEGCNVAGCPNGGENYSNWYAVKFNTAGTFSLNIVPNVATDDYDYAVFGPNVNCDNLGSPIRCSDAMALGVTGMRASALDFSEDVYGDAFTAPMNVSAGQTYFVMVDEWTPTGAGYTLNFGGTAVMSCDPISIPLPVELNNFNATYNSSEKTVKLDWTTASEFNNDYFAVERSLDAVVYEQIDIVKGKGTSNSLNKYYSTDNYPNPDGINYYRLRQVDFDGELEFSEIKAVAIYDPRAFFKIMPNPSENTASLYFNSSYEQEFFVYFYDNLSRLVYKTSLRSSVGINTIPIDLTDIHSGIYQVVLKSSNQNEIFKTTFVKL